MAGYGGLGSADPKGWDSTDGAGLAHAERVKPLRGHLGTQVGQRILSTCLKDGTQDTRPQALLSTAPHSPSQPG